MSEQQQGPEAELAANLRQFEFMPSVDVRLTNEQLMQITVALERVAAADAGVCSNCGHAEIEHVNDACFASGCNCYRGSA